MGVDRVLDLVTGLVLVVARFPAPRTQIDASHAFRVTLRLVPVA